MNETEKKAIHREHHFHTIILATAQSLRSSFKPPLNVFTGVDFEMLRENAKEHYLVQASTQIPHFLKNKNHPHSAQSWRA